MKGKVNDGALVTGAPCQPEELSVGDIVLVRVKGNDYLHPARDTTAFGCRPGAGGRVMRGVGPTLR